MSNQLPPEVNTAAWEFAHRVKDPYETNDLHEGFIQGYEYSAPYIKQLEERIAKLGEVAEKAWWRNSSKEYAKDKEIQEWEQFKKENNL